MAHWACFAGLLALLPPSWTHLCHQPLLAEVDVGQCQGRERPCRIILQPTVAHLAKPPQPLDHAQHVLHPRVDARLVAVLALQGLVPDAIAPGALVGEVFGSGRLACDQLFLTGIGRVTVDTPLMPMQQVGQGMLVMGVRRCDHGTVRQAALAVHPDVQLHAEIPLLTLAGLMHLRVSRLVCILGRAGRANDGGVYDGAGVELESSGLQLLSHLGKQGLAQLVVIKQTAKLQHRGGVGHRLSPQINPHEAAQAGAVVQRFFADQVGQVEPVLDEVNAQHALQTNGRAAIACLGVVRLDDFAQR